MKALSFGQLAWLGRSYHAEDFVEGGLVFRRSGERRLREDRRHWQNERKKQEDCPH